VGTPYEIIKTYSSPNMVSKVQTTAYHARQVILKAVYETYLNILSTTTRANLGLQI